MQEQRPHRTSDAGCRITNNPPRIGPPPRRSFESAQARSARQRASDQIVESIHAAGRSFRRFDAVTVRPVSGERQEIAVIAQLVIFRNRRRRAGFNPAGEPPRLDQGQYIVKSPGALGGALNTGWQMESSQAHRAVESGPPPGQRRPRSYRCLDPRSPGPASALRERRSLVRPLSRRRRRQLAGSSRRVGRRRPPSTTRHRPELVRRRWSPGTSIRPNETLPNTWSLAPAEKPAGTGVSRPDCRSRSGSNAVRPRYRWLRERWVDRVPDKPGRQPTGAARLSCGYDSAAFRIEVKRASSARSTTAGSPSFFGDRSSPPAIGTPCWPRNKLPIPIWARRAIRLLPTTQMPSTSAGRTMAQPTRVPLLIMRIPHHRPGVIHSTLRGRTFSPRTVPSEWQSDRLFPDSADCLGREGPG